MSKKWVNDEPDDDEPKEDAVLAQIIATLENANEKDIKGFYIQYLEPLQKEWKILEPIMRFEQQLSQVLFEYNNLCGCAKEFEESSQMRLFTDTSLMQQVLDKKANKIVLEMENFALTKLAADIKALNLLFPEVGVESVVKQLREAGMTVNEDQVASVCTVGKTLKEAEKQLLALVNSNVLW